MALLCDFPFPAPAREAFAGGFSDKGTALLTLDELEMYSSGQGNRTERLYKCPFCGASERAFHVNVETGAFNCKRSSCSVRGCLRELWPSSQPLAPNAFGSAHRRAHVKNAAFDLTPQKLFEPTTGGNWRELWSCSTSLDDHQAKAGRAFLCERKVCLQAAKSADVRFCVNWAPSAEGKSYQGGAAILFPLLDRHGEIVAVNGRYLQPKSQGPKTRTGGDAAQGVFRAGPHAFDVEQPVLVEGPIDALALATCGVCAWAMSGVAVPAWLPLALAMKAPFLAPDSDEGGNKAVEVWWRHIAPFAPRARVLRSRHFKDFGEFIQRSGAATLRAWLLKEGVPSKSEADAEVESQPPLRRASRRVEREQPDFWHRLSLTEQHELAVCVAMLDAGQTPDLGQSWPQQPANDLCAQKHPPTRAQQVEAARACLALPLCSHWGAVRPLFAIAHAALYFDPTFKAEHLKEWAHRTLADELAKRSEERTL